LGKGESPSPICQATGNQGRSELRGLLGICETRPAAVVANIAVCLIHQTDFLLDRQIGRLERDFVQEGGLRERMTRAR